MNTIIINGASSGGKNTTLIDQYVKDVIQCDICNLNELNIYSYRYDNIYPEDDVFLETITMILKKYDTIIWSTPMYWYAMSGLMKQFLDRMTALLDEYKDLGRKLRGKKMLLIYNSNGETVAYFEKPFENTSDYLGMVYLGSLHINMEEKILVETDKRRLKEFLEEVDKFQSKK